MSTESRYAMHLDTMDWTIRSEFGSNFRWEYADGRESLVNLYEKGKKLQWNANDRIDWSLDLDPENPQGLPDEQIPIYGSPIWDRLTLPERGNLRRHLQAYQLSQFLHGEQGALLCAAKVVQQVQNMDAKLFAATQVVDEARHVEAYSRLLHDKFELAYPISSTLKSLLNNVLSDSRWDITYLGMQVLVEGLAMAVFASVRDQSKSPLTASVNAYVMQDEARHIAFGRLALRDFYPSLTDKERDEREEFVVDACYMMRDRMVSLDVWQNLGLPVEECVATARKSERLRQFRKRLFIRIVPTIKDIGLWGPRVRRAYADMGVIEYAETNTEALLAHDERAAAEFDARRQALVAPTP
jgi:hypothetical protein